MDIDIYFQPIKALEYAKNTLGYFTDFHTQDNFPFWEESDIAIIGVNEDRGRIVIKDVLLVQMLYVKSYLDCIITIRTLKFVT